MSRATSTKSTTKPTITKEVACPFCSLLCDDLIVQNDNEQLKVVKNGCPKAIAAFEQPQIDTSPSLKGKKVSLQQAIAAAAAILKKSQQPLIAGLGSDVSGMRQMMRLADQTGAIMDHMHGDAIMRDSLVLQDYGWITTTFAEVKNRADLIIFAGTDGTRLPRFFERVVWNQQTLYQKGPPARNIVYIGENLNTKAGGKRPTLLNCKTDQIGEVVSSLQALVAGAKLDVKQVAGIQIKKLEALAKQMKAAQYGVLVWSPKELRVPHAELVIQRFCEIVKYLNRTTRFAGLSLGGDDGAVTANTVCTWQSGYPVRVNFNQGYPDYDPHRYASDTVLKNKIADALVWVSSFSSNIAPPKAFTIPTIVLAKPDLKLSFKPDVLIPVSTPGVDHAGQLFRADSVIALPLKKIRRSPHASVSHIIGQLLANI